MILGDMAVFAAYRSWNHFFYVMYLFSYNIYTIFLLSRRVAK